MIPIRFHSLRPTTLLYLFPCIALFSHGADYRYYRFTPTQLRNDATSNSIQLSEFGFYTGSGGDVDMATATVTNPGGRSPDAEGPVNLVDGDTGTKWLDFNKSVLVIDFGATTTVDGYYFATANDAIDRDPISWTLEGSADGATWTLLDNVLTAAVPETRGTYTADFELPATPAPIDFVWTGASDTEWNTTSQNWDNGAPATWDSTILARALFGAGSPTTVTLTEPINARVLQFDAPGYSIQSDTLTLVGVSRLRANEDATIASTLAGAGSLVKTGPSEIELTGDSTYAGPTFVREGTLSYIGTATRTVLGNLELAVPSGTAVLEQAGDSTIVFGGNPGIGTGQDAVGIIRQSGGSSTYASGGGYLSIANGTDSFGALELSDGSLVTGADSGIRLGLNGTGNLIQTGGDLTSNRWFAVGGDNSTGIATFLGGSATVTANWRLIVGDRSGSTAVINVGTLAGGDAVLNGLRPDDGDGSIIVGGTGGAQGHLNLNNGTILLHGSIYKGGGAGFFNANGGTLQAGRDGVILVKSGLQTVTRRGGLRVDTNGFNASIEADIFRPFANGVDFSDGTLSVAAGGTGYLTPPVVRIETDGVGFDAFAVAEVENGVVTGITITNPGEDYQEGDELSISFIGGGTDDPAPGFTHILTASDLDDGAAGGLVKTGTGTLTLSGNSDYLGATVVEEGTLAANGSLDATPLQVAAGATLTGNLNTLGDVSIEGTLAPGDGIGTATGTAALALLPGSSLGIQIGDWTGAAGTGYDTANFDSLAISSTTGSKLTIQIDGSGIANFSESAQTFVIATASSTPAGLTADNWQVATSNFPGTGTWSLEASGNDLVLHYEAGEGGYSSWLAGFPAISDGDPDADPDQDGLTNLLEYILNGDPTSGNDSVLPTVDLEPSNYVLTFIRRTESKADTTQTFEYSADLGAWTSISIPATSGESVTVVPDTPSSGLETITVTLPRTLAEDGKLFGRLRAVRP